MAHTHTIYAPYHWVDCSNEFFSINRRPGDVEVIYKFLHFKHPLLFPGKRTICIFLFQLFRFYQFEKIFRTIPCYTMVCVCVWARVWQEPLGKRNFGWLPWKIFHFSLFNLEKQPTYSALFAIFIAHLDHQQYGLGSFFLSFVIFIIRLNIEFQLNQIKKDFFTSLLISISKYKIQWQTRRMVESVRESWKKI